MDKENQAMVRDCKAREERLTESDSKRIDLFNQIHESGGDLDEIQATRLFMIWKVATRDG